MPATSPEAIERKKQRRRQRRTYSVIPEQLPMYKVTARRMMPRLDPNISKAELREMLRIAVSNTVGK